MIIRLKDLPSEIMDCEFIIITHRLGSYFFENDRCFKNGKELKMQRCGNSNGYKINGVFKSLTWLKQHRVPYIDVWVDWVELMPF